MKFNLQFFVESTFNEELPAAWQGFDLDSFAKTKQLFSFQKNGLQNAIKALYIFYCKKEGNKKAYYHLLRQGGLYDDLDYAFPNYKDNKTLRILLEYENDFPLVDKKISFEHFINRMNFWMATGSGKTLLIVKLIAILSWLMQKKEIPQRDILFLTYREDLIEQFIAHVEEYNQDHLESKIALRSLKEYESIKHANVLPFLKNEITVYYYRSDLISDEHKEKLIDFRNYDDQGRWYILLDEAHKGDREESKRQILYTILSRNGFLFNFSATFTDPRDFATCVYNFNLARFIQDGYGKHIIISKIQVDAFKKSGVMPQSEKQKIILKNLLLFTYIKKSASAFARLPQPLYHQPLLLTLVNSVDTKDADLKLFFDELVHFAKNGVNLSFFNTTKEELMLELGRGVVYEFENESLIVDNQVMKSIAPEDILHHFFHAKAHGEIEVITIPNNKNELIFKLKTTEKPFALIKIGDITGWLKDKLAGYEIIEKVENESIFKALNKDDSDINILLGSRSFYEGWDSNRPNIILFINIGVGKDAKKFVLQSIGRGVRIEPIKNKRGRVSRLLTECNGLVDHTTYAAQISALETLFVFGTDPANVQEIVATLQAEKQSHQIGNLFDVNPSIKERTLLIPIYKQTRMLVEEQKNIKYTLSENEYIFIGEVLRQVSDKVLVMKYQSDISVLSYLRQCFKETSSKEICFKIAEKQSLDTAEDLLGRLIKFYSIRQVALDKFKKLENEIVHFKKIQFFNGEKAEEIKRKIEIIKQKIMIEKELEEQYGLISREEYNVRQLALFDAGKFEYYNQAVNLKHLTHYYYIPLIISEREKISYLNHIIDVESEIHFVNALERYIQKPFHNLQRFDWWLFSKLDETLDEVYIPYYNPQTNSIAKYIPDFIFWLQKGNDYIILFVDPKGTEYLQAERKIDGFIHTYGVQRHWMYDELKVKVFLKFFTEKGISFTSSKYRNYWCDNMDNLFAELDD